MINRQIEKSLDLGRVQIHREHAIRACDRQHIRHQFCGNGHARLVFAVLARVAEIGNHGVDAVRGRAARRIAHDEQLKKVFHRGIG